MSEVEVGKEGGEGKENTGAQEEEKVVLEPEQYNALLDRLHDLEELALKGGRGKARTVDELAEDLEQRPAPARENRVDPNQINNLTNLQLAQMILQEVNHTVTTPLLTKLEEIRVSEEIKDLRRELKATDSGDDFDDLKDEIYKVASRNPNLSIKQAYKLAKKDEAAKGKDISENEGSERTTKGKDVLRHLPPRVPFSERPTHSRSATDLGPASTRQEAAERAIKDMEKAGTLKL